MSEKTIKISKEEAFKKIDQQIEKGLTLVEEGSKTFKKSMGRAHLADDGFENEYKMWLMITKEILSDIFISSNYGDEFEKRKSSKTEYVSSDWKPDIKYWIGKELIPKIDYLVVLRENIDEFEFMPSEQKTSEDAVGNLDNKKGSSDTENKLGLVKL